MECPQCKGRNFADTRESTVVCTDCGCIVQESTFEDVVDDAGSRYMPRNSTFLGAHVSMTGVIHQSYHEAIQSKIMQTLNAYGGRLGLKHDHLEQCRELLRQLYAKRKLWPSGERKQLLLVASVICIVVRRARLPRGIIDVTKEFALPYADIGKEYMDTVSELGITLPALDPSLAIHRGVTELLKGSSASEQGVIRDAYLIIRAAEQRNLIDGRHPGTISAAATILAAQAHRVNASLITYEKVGRVYGVGRVAVGKRYTEISELILQLAAPLAWMTGKVTGKTLKAHMESIMQHWDSLQAMNLVPDCANSFVATVQSAPTTADHTSIASAMTARTTPSAVTFVSARPPPSFQRSVQVKRARAEKIVAAVKRVRPSNDGRPPGAAAAVVLDDEDRLIESFLREGVRPQMMVEGRYDVIQSFLVERKLKLRRRGDRDLNSEELKDSDLTDIEASQYFRSASDATLVQDLMSSQYEMPSVL
eukprot:TRINITY_DN15213_c0_g1_i1.p1 TRINITY_DN15213_c0_g1~~TRINITY_DN15213_c0_g1_i1.p1  ORF type:complete len:478 (+),score=75.99 TRINITY_DN15213_c0_g1_i1:49-1482(+)